MKTTKEYITEHLQAGRAAQIATSCNNTPWVCSVYYVVDDALNIYWLSYPDRRHSTELTDNPHTAFALAVKLDAPVIGVQAEGVSKKVTQPVTVAKVMLLYVKKYGLGKKFYDNFVHKKNKHYLYCFTPTRFALFDEQNFSGEYAQEVLIDDRP